MVLAGRGLAHKQLSLGQELRQTVGTWSNTQMQGDNGQKDNVKKNK